MHRLVSALSALFGILVIPTLLHAQVDPDASAVVQAPPPVEDSPLLSEPETPEATFDAVVLMLDLERPNLVNYYLDLLIQADPDDATILRMRDKHGPAAFLQLANDRRFRPNSLKLLNRMNQAFRKFAYDPTRIDALIQGLNGGPRQRELSMIQLRNTGAVAVPRMLEIIANASDSSVRQNIVYALTRMGKHTIPALQGGLDSPSASIQSVVAEALGYLGSQETLVWLWHPAFGPGVAPGVQDTAQRAIARIVRGDPARVAEISSFGAVSSLERTARTHFRNEYDWKLSDQGLVELWAWDQQGNRLTMWEVAPKTASLVTGSRFAKQALQMSPQRQELQSLYLALRLSFDSHVVGLDKPLPSGPGTAHDLALRAGPDLAMATLSESLKNPTPSAALASLHVLSQVGSRKQLIEYKGSASPIMAALNYPDQRVQFAAASTVLQLDPDKPFRGANRIVSVLTRALNDGGVRSALAIDPNSQRGTTIASRMTALGYDPVSAVTGQDGFSMAASRGDIELIAIHAACIRWGLNQTIANLRADARTAGIPIVIYGPESVALAAGRVARRYPLVGFALEGEQSFKVGVERFLDSRKTPTETDEQRNQRIEVAGYWFAHIASGRRTDIYNINGAETVLFEAVNLPQVGDNAIVAMGAIPTETAQQRLQELVIADTRDPAQRETAAMQLAFHIQKHGVLMKSDRVLQLNQAWEAATEPALKTALAAVVGSFRPKPERITELLESLPEAAIPSVP